MTLKDISVERFLDILSEKRQDVSEPAELTVTRANGVEERYCIYQIHDPRILEKPPVPWLH